jgi:hypothetical protein
VFSRGRRVDPWTRIKTSVGEWSYKAVETRSVGLPTSPTKVAIVLHSLNALRRCRWRLPTLRTKFTKRANSPRA